MATIGELVNVYNALVLDAFAEAPSVVNSGAITKDTNDLDLRNLGETVNVLTPSPLQVYDFDGSSPVVRQDPQFTTKSVTLDKLKDSTFKVDSKFFDAANRYQTFEKFAKEAAKAILADIESNIALQYASAGSSIGDGSTGWTADLVLQARKALNDARAHEEDRYIICKDDTSFYQNGLISAKDKVIILENGTAKAVQDIPAYAGFNIIRSPYIKEVDSKNRDLALQKNGILFVNRPLEEPKTNAVTVSILQKNGVSMRTTYWYDPNLKQHLLSTDLLYTVETIEPSLVIEVQTKP